MNPMFDFDGEFKVLYIALIILGIVIVLAIIFLTVIIKPVNNTPHPTVVANVAPVAPVALPSFQNKRIKAVAGGRCIVPRNGSVSSDYLQMYDCNSSAAQQFSYDPNTVDKSIKNTNSGLCINHYGATDVITQTTCDSSPAQQWTTVPQANGLQFQSGLDPSKCINIQGAIGNNDDKLIAYSCAQNNDNEHFSFI